MDILDETNIEIQLSEYTSERKKNFVILACVSIPFFACLILSYFNGKSSFGRSLWWSISITFFLSIVPGLIALSAILFRRNPKKVFLIVFAIQFLLIISYVPIILLGNESISIIYSLIIVSALIITGIVGTIKLFKFWFSNLKEAGEGQFSTLFLSGLVAFSVFIFIFITYNMQGFLPDLLRFGVLPIATISIVGYFATIKYRRNMEKTLGRKTKGDYELSSFSSWMETPTEKISANQKVQAKNSQKIPTSLVNNSTELRKSVDSPLNLSEENPKIEETQKEKFAKKSESLTKQDLAQVRVNFDTLLESEDEVRQRLLIRNTNQSLEPHNLHKPRAYHYLFAHKYLPDKLSKSPKLALSWLTSEKGTEHLKTRWSLLPTVYKLETKDFIEPVGIDRYVLFPKDGVTLIIVRFPKPLYMTEAYFSAIIHNQKNNRLRYFTLELSFSESDNNVRVTVVGEWEGDNHINHGNGTLPNVESFASLIIERFI